MLDTITNPGYILLAIFTLVTVYLLIRVTFNQKLKDKTTKGFLDKRDPETAFRETAEQAEKIHSQFCKHCTGTGLGDRVRRHLEVIVLMEGNKPKVSPEELTYAFTKTKRKKTVEYRIHGMNLSTVDEYTYAELSILANKFHADGRTFLTDHEIVCIAKYRGCGSDPTSMPEEEVKRLAACHECKGAGVIYMINDKAVSKEEWQAAAGTRSK